MTYQRFTQFWNNNRGKSVCIKYSYNQQGHIDFNPEAEHKYGSGLVQWLSRFNTELRLASMAGAASVTMLGCDTPPLDTTYNKTIPRQVHFDELNLPTEQPHIGRDSTQNFITARFSPKIQLMPPLHQPPHSIFSQNTGFGGYDIPDQPPPKLNAGPEPIK
jgi:hypothetical protein